VPLPVKILDDLVILAVAPTEDRIGSVRIAGRLAGSVVDNNYSFDTYVRSPSIQKISLSIPLHSI
jgi:hypothetical protein